MIKKLIAGSALVTIIGCAEKVKFEGNIGDAKVRLEKSRTIFDEFSTLEVDNHKDCKYTIKANYDMLYYGKIECKDFTLEVDSDDPADIENLSIIYKEYTTKIMETTAR